jgi:hypothetical protein
MGTSVGEGRRESSRPELLAVCRLQRPVHEGLVIQNALACSMFLSSSFKDTSKVRDYFLEIGKISHACDVTVRTLVCPARLSMALVRSCDLRSALGSTFAISRVPDT